MRGVDFRIGRTIIDGKGLICFFWRHDVKVEINVLKHHFVLPGTDFNGLPSGDGRKLSYYLRTRFEG